MIFLKWSGEKLRWIVRSYIHEISPLRVVCDLQSLPNLAIYKILDTLMASLVNLSCIFLPSNFWEKNEIVIRVSIINSLSENQILTHFFIEYPSWLMRNAWTIFLDLVHLKDYCASMCSFGEKKSTTLI